MFILIVLLLITKKFPNKITIPILIMLIFGVFWVGYSILFDNISPTLLLRDSFPPFSLITCGVILAGYNHKWWKLLKNIIFIVACLFVLYAFVEIIIAFSKFGFNYRMTNLQAALGVAQVEKLPEFIARKQSNYDLYKKEFAGFELASLIEFRQGTESNKWFYSLEIKRHKVTASMSDIISKLQEKGIQTRAIWGLINEQKPYLQFESYMVEKAVYYAERILNIPCSTQITEEEIIYVSSEIKHLLEELADE